MSDYTLHEMTGERAQELSVLALEQHEARNALLAARLSSDPQKMIDAADHYRRVTHELGDWFDNDIIE